MAEMRLISVIFCFLAPFVVSQDCTPTTCENGGTCVPRPSGGVPMCLCTLGFNGETCGEAHSLGANCGEDFFNMTRGDLLSPNHPDQYPSRRNCYYFVYFPGAQNIRLVYNVIDIEPQKDDIYIGGGPTASIDAMTSVDTYNGLYGTTENPLPPPLTISNDIVWISFITDKNDPNGPFAGFNITFIVDRNECVFNSNLCPAGFICEDLDFDYTCREIDECANDPCINDGTCTDLVNAYSCSCPTGYAGNRCETVIDHCISGPCVAANTQNCVSSTTSYQCVCVPGYTGVMCENEINECTSNPCMNGGTCTDLINSYICTCVAGYTGPLCQTDINDCSPNPCANGGVCTDMVNSYTCQCAAGFEGTDCTTNINECASNPCRNGAVCTDLVNGFQCTCLPGYTGTTCSENIDECGSSPCKNAGTCIDRVNGFDCDCPAGFTGVLCDIDINECDPDPCVFGQCTDLINMYSCTCDPGYTGTDCNIDINECMSDPCVNGNCDDMVNDYECLCNPGYTGRNCDIDINECQSSPCQNGGFCVNQVNMYQCNCLDGFDGVNCGNDIDECASGPCLNGAACVDQINGYICNCATGFQGLTCGENVDDCQTDSCSLQGDCTDQVNGFTCTCFPGWTGDFCRISVDDCTPQPCRNGGTCVDGHQSFTCNCQPGYSGTLCEINNNECASSPCRNNGDCTDAINSYTCTCPPGWTGVICEINIDECESSPCRNGGNCIDEVNGFRCSCSAGWTGVVCNDDIDECLSSPCLNGATCRNEQKMFTCVCAAGFQGITCATDINECMSSPCGANGICNNGKNLYTCTCFPGYTGLTCDIEIDLCMNNPCSNMATCNNFRVYYTCECAAGFEGPNCDIDSTTSLIPTEAPSTVRLVNGTGAHEGRVEVFYLESWGTVCDDSWSIYDARVVCRSVGYQDALSAPHSARFGQGSGPIWMDDVGCGGNETHIFDCPHNGFGKHNCYHEEDASVVCLHDHCSSDPCEQFGSCVQDDYGYFCYCPGSYTGQNCELQFNGNTSCSRNYYESKGNITSPFYPDGYGARLECNYQLKIWTAKKITLIMQDFVTEPGRDFLIFGEGPEVIYDGPNVISITGNLTNLPLIERTYTFANNQVFLTFISDSNIIPPRGYFHITYTADINECSFDPCQNDASCIDGVNDFTCTCIAGFTGTRCETNINECSSNPCLNDASCIDGVNGFTCFCNPGFTSTTCVTNINECVSNPCRNGGSCLDGVNEYRCICIAGFTGTICETNINECISNPCRNGGSCIDGVNFYTCNCIDGFTDTSCETDINECGSDPCLNGGLCNDRVDGFTCECNSGFTGARCERDINECASAPCLNGGFCNDRVDGFTCFCHPGFTGTGCETNINECLSNPCGNGGSCVDGFNDYRCICIAGFTGTTCETNINDCISDPCLNDGFCIDLICYCHYGYKGDFCEIYIDECESGLCQNDGTCRNLENSFECVCVTGFIGVYCEIAIGDCGGYPCVNGVCRGEGYCQCDPEYMGDFCSIKRTCSNVTMETEFGQARLPMTEVGIVIDSEELCPEEDSEGPVASIIRAACLVSSNGTTYWNASIRCQDDITRQLMEILMNGIFDANVAEEVFTITQNYDDITAIDIGLLYEILQHLADLNYDANVTGLIVGIVNNVMFVEEEVLASAQEKDNYTALIVQVLEYQLNTVDVVNGTLDRAYPNIAVQVLDIPSDTARDGIVITMLSMDTGSLSNSDIMVETHQDTPSDSVPRDTFARVVVPIEVAQVFTTPDVTEGPSSSNNTTNGDNLGTTTASVVSSGPGETMGVSAIESLRVAFVVYVNDAMFPSPSLALLNRETKEFNREINTPVVSLTIGGQKIENLMERVNITFFRFEPDSRDPTCNFWEFNLGKWSMEGCQLLPDNAINSFSDEYYTCACNHLTNFAVLVDIYAEDEPPKPALRILSIIGCAISCVCLVIAIMSYLSVKKIRRSQTHKIFICLCTTLLCLYTVSLAIIALDTEFKHAEVERIPCTVLAALVHYFVLSSLMWMGIEGFNTYLVIVKVFNIYIPNFMIRASIIGWGIPAVIVVATAGITIDYYAVEDYCYIRKWPLIGGLLVPMAIILIINIAVFILAMRRLQNSARMPGRVKKDCKIERQETLERIQNGIAMLLLLGFTWTTGYLSLINVDFSELLFIIFNSLQGFFIFVLYCLRKETIRKQWRRCICCVLLREGGSAESQRNSGRTPGSTSGTGGSQPMFESSSAISHTNPSFENSN